MPNLIATRVSDMPLDKKVVSILRVLDYLTKLYNFFSYFYLALIAKKSESSYNPVDVSNKNREAESITKPTPLYLPSAAAGIFHLTIH